MSGATVDATRSKVSVDIARHSDFLPLPRSQRQFPPLAPRAPAESLCQGLMATPSGKATTPDMVAARVLVAVLITETSLDILFET
jgi:hypothetical protein